MRVLYERQLCCLCYQNRACYQWCYSLHQNNIITTCLPGVPILSITTIDCVPSSHASTNYGMRIQYISNVVNQYPTYLPLPSLPFVALHVSPFSALALLHVRKNVSVKARGPRQAIVVLAKSFRRPIPHDNPIHSDVTTNSARSGAVAGLSMARVGEQSARAQDQSPPTYLGSL